MAASDELGEDLRRDDVQGHDNNAALCAWSEWRLVQRCLRWIRGLKAWRRGERRLSVTADGIDWIDGVDKLFGLAG